MRKRSIDDVRKAFVERGYKLVEHEYKNNRTKMKYICKKHPDKNNSITFSNLQKGHGCPYCARLKVDFSDVKEEFKQRGYELLSTEYENNLTKLRYRCPNHPGIREIKYTHFQRGRGCYDCGLEKIGGIKRNDYDKVKEEFESRGLKLVSKSYLNDVSELKFICQNHPKVIQRSTLSSIRASVGCCGLCRIDKVSGENHHNWQGGLSEISLYLRGRTKEWNMNKLRESDYTCFVTGTKGRLEVHHTKPFHQMRDEVFQRIGIEYKRTIGEYTEAELNTIIEKMKQEHQSVPGVVMKKEVHKLFHKEYGIKTDIYDVYEFRERYLSGDFGEVEQGQRQLELIM